MNTNYQKLSDVVRASLAGEDQPTADVIRERVGQFRAIPGHEVSDAEANHLCREIEASHDIYMEIGSVIQEEFTEWLDASKPMIEPYYWDRYKRLLQQKRFPSRVISRLDDVTDRILGLLENPAKEGGWDRRGMVVGHVQSGKTANYTGLICKAADAGYRLIVVIAGIHNNLRNQTQARIDEGFVGRDSSSLLANNTSRVIGVGKFGTREFPLTVTNTKQDFNKRTASTLGVQLRALNVPAILVIKKNASTLKHLNEWLRTHNAQGQSNLVDAPMLLIDDEADNASIDISRDPEKASTINSRIRELLAMFSRSCYVGYTATPFANIFIDPNNEQEMLGADLFPRDFIISLEAPSNYFGASRIFGEEGEADVVREIRDSEDLLPMTHKNHHEVVQLPPSLLEAVRTFVLARAVRMFRGQVLAHNSMLVNLSRFTSVQSEVRDLLHEYKTTLERSVRYIGTEDPTEALRDDDVRDLHATWTREFSSVGVGWPDVYPLLLDSIAPMTIIEVNSRSPTALEYEAYKESGRQVIAVGGFSLSRGLTLEGLTVSYFLRNSKMYDTLMQMGRWFGYRPDYEDVCRVWMTAEALGWYEHITESIEELRSELRGMEQARLTPREFGLKVRSHPDNLIVTARNKMGSAETFAVRIGLANRFIETYAVPRDPEQLGKNLQAARGLVERIRSEDGGIEIREGSSFLWRNVPVALVRQFLQSWWNAKESIQTDTGPVVDYINRRNPDELGTWDVVLVGLNRSEQDSSDALGPPIFCQERTAGRESTRACLYISNKNRVASRGAERYGLSEVEKQDAMKWWKKEASASGKKSANVPDRAYREKRRTPLLLLHLIRLSQPEHGLKVSGYFPEEPIVAWGISFPKSDHADPTVEYVVNTTWMREAFADERDEDEGENGGDD